MYLHNLWQQILTFLSREIPRNQLLTFFSRTAIFEFENGKLKIGVPHPTAQATIANKFLAILLKCAREVEPEIREIVIEVDGALLSKDDSRSVDITKIFPSEKSAKKTREGLSAKKSVQGGASSRTGTRPEDESATMPETDLDADSEMRYFNKHALQPHYTLNNFIVGKDNRLAHAAATAVSNRPGTEYNPLFIYGGVGLGKTHLIQAIGNEILKNNPDAVVLYLTAERLLNEYVAAIKKFQMQNYRNRYRNVDCLIVDDIQFIADKTRLQEEFFHTFNDLRDARKQIVMSSDRPPKELLEMEDRLKSRFESGMIVEVYFPEFETRLAILQHKCQEQKIVLTPEILEFVAANVHQNIRELEGFLTQIVAKMKHENFIPTIRSVAQLMKKQNGEQKLVGISDEEMTREIKVKTPEDIMNLVCEYFKIPRVELTGPSRKKEVLVARQLCMYLMYEICHYSYDSIGDYFQNRNHTTVLHAHHKIRELILRDQKIASDATALKREMGL